MKPWSKEVFGVDFLHLFICDGHVGKNCALRSQILLLHSSSRSYSLYRKVVSYSVICPTNEISIELGFGGNGMKNDLQFNTCKG